MIEYETAAVEEIDRIIELKKKMFDEAGHGQLLAKNAESTIHKDYVEMYSDNSAIHFIAKFNGEIVGMVGAFLKSDIPYCYFSPNQYGFIGDVYTEEEYRGRGIAMKLNQDALIWLKEKGVTLVKLLASEKGRPIYEKLGFTPTDEMELDIAT